MTAEILLTARELEKSFGARPLFSGVSLVVAAGERIGLIGPNGAGKSTLLKIVAGRLSADEGELAPRRGLRVGYLEQAPAFPGAATVLATLAEAAAGDEEWDRAAASRDAFARLGLAAAGIGEETPIGALSGGWRKRIALGRELLRQPDLLLLDEPTNHLDVDGIEWLEELLAASRFATVTVTHDRVFLQRVSTRIVELDRRHPAGMLSVDGGYLRYLEVRGQNLAAQERREVVLRNTLRRETEWLRRGAPARTTKQDARIQRAGALSDEVSELTTRNALRTAQLALSATDRSPKRLIEAEAIAKAYGDRVLFRDETVRLGPGTRLGLLGANGCGKSTLIRVLVGQEAPDAGRVVRADGLRVAYFEQGRETLDPAMTVRDTLCPGGDQVEIGGKRMHVRGYLDRFLFTAEQTEVQVGKLSGGEQSRLLLARLMLRPANLLILDEPTNDLDTATLTVLEEALTSFAGAVLLVTHDRYFLDQVATEIVAFPRQSGAGLALQRFASLAQWERWHRAERAAAAPKKVTTAELPSAPARKKLTYAERLELEGIEDRILEAEAFAVAAEAALASPEHASNATKLIQLATALEQARVIVDGLYARWELLEGKRGGV